MGPLHFWNRWSLNIESLPRTCSTITIIIKSRHEFQKLDANGSCSKHSLSAASFSIHATTSLSIHGWCLSHLRTAYDELVLKWNNDGTAHGHWRWRAIFLKLQSSSIRTFFSSSSDEWRTVSKQKTSKAFHGRQRYPPFQVLTAPAHWRRHK